MTEQQRIFLVGPMGAGKTTIGKRLAKAIKRRFVDCDHELERRTGVSIAVIFEVEGESGFRERERRMLDELTQLDDVVLATGGGAVLDEGNRELLCHRGFTVYLYANVDDLLSRTRNDVNRPLLKAPDRVQRLREIVTAREPLYREVAALAVDTGAHTLSEIVALIRSKCGV